MVRYDGFSYLSTPKVGEYRSVQEVFAKKWSECILHPRSAIGRFGLHVDLVERPVDQLEEWMLPRA